MFRFRKLADYSDGSTRVVRFDPISGEKMLVDPETNEPKAWPLKGVTHQGDLPALDTIGMHYVAQAVTDGWADWENHRTVHRPGGSVNNPWSTTHTFHQCDRIHLHLLLPHDGQFVSRNVVYKVIRQPDRVEDPTQETGWRVDWTFQVKLVAVSG